MRLLTPMEKGLRRLDTVLFDIKRQITRDLEKEQEEDRRKAESLLKLQKADKALLPQKIELAEKIMAWADEFSSSNVFRELIRLGLAGIYALPGIMLKIGPQGHHILLERDRGLWSQIALGDSGVLLYRYGFKQMCSPGGEKSFSTAGDLTDYFTHDYLRSLCSHIESGMVYRFIEKQCYQNADRLLSNYIGQETIDLEAME